MLARTDFFKSLLACIMRAMTVSGIHHITAISSNPQETYDFYTRVLGLRLVKKSVNQDDPATYHLFFGNKTGGPGMDLTFFPFQPSRPGENGPGFVTGISLAVPAGSLKWWQERFDHLHVEQAAIIERFGEKVLPFRDADGQQLELVEVSDFSFDFEELVWTTEEISQEHAIRCFHSATLSVQERELLQPLLEIMGYEPREERENLIQFRLPKEGNAAQLIVALHPGEDLGYTGAGTVHHIAFTVEDQAEQAIWIDRLRKLGLQPTTIIDRYYFASVYFRTPAGILFELATKEPGFTADEDLGTLGEELALPPFLEPYRTQIEAGLPPLVNA
jgi:glyoxalase family protein